MKRNEKCVIKDKEGYFIPGSKAFVFTDDELSYCFFTGMASGFVCYSDQITATKEKEKLQQLNNDYGANKQFHIEYIEDLIKTVKKGKFMTENISSSMYNRKIANV